MKFHLICLIFIYSFIGLPSNVWAQEDIASKIEVLKKIESDSLRVSQFHSLYDLIQSDDNANVKAEIFHELGMGYSKLQNNTKAIEFYLKAIESRKKDKTANATLINASRYALSIVYKRQLKFEEQNQIFNSIIKEGQKDLITAKAHSNIGRNMVRKGDYHSGIQYLNSILADTELMKSIDNELILRLKIIFIYSLKYESTFEANDDSPDLENLKKHQFEVERKIHQSNINEISYYAMHTNLANVYGAFDGELITALNSYQKTLNYYKELGDEYYTLLSISNIGNIYSKQNLHKKANICYQEVIEKSTNPDLIAIAYVNKGYFLNVDSAETKIPYFYKALNILNGKNKNDKISFVLPTLKEIRATIYELDFLICLIDLSAILVQSYKESNDIKYLHDAKETIYLIDQLVSRIRYESNSQESKLDWIKRGVDTYMLGVEVCKLLNLTEEAFYFMEKNKALLLQENIKTLQAKCELDIPSETLEKEYDMYYSRIDWYEKFLQQPNDSIVKKEYTWINKAYASFMDSLEQRHPGYTKTKKQVEIISLDEAVSQYVSEDKCIVEYILNDQDGYGVFCSSDEKLLFKIPDAPALQSELSLLHEYCTKTILNKTETSKFQKLGASVFSKLFPFQDAKSKLKDKQITIVADQNLKHIPFEALSVSTDLNLADSYLVNFSEIVYLQSISVFHEIQQKENNPQFALLGLAPLDFEFDDLPALTTSKDAMKVLSNFKSSKILVNDEATKNNFLQEINDYQIIHLNTHAGIDAYNLEPWIAFKEQKMGLNELYGKENQAELVVLDACKTNDGKLLSGEGILNLSRGFFYNGAQSVLASNWNVNEKSGNEIIRNFYDGLQEGKTKSKSLQLAKIDYLNDHQYSEALPYYWAAYTLTGSTDSIELKSNSQRSFIILLLSSVGLLLILLYLFRRIKF